MDDRPDIETLTDPDPDPAHPGGLIVHTGQRGGHWPSSAEIGSAMLDRDPPAPG